MACTQNPCATILSDVKGEIIRYVVSSPQFSASNVELAVGSVFETFLRGLEPSIESVGTALANVDTQKAARKLNHLTSYAVFEHASVIEREAPEGIGVALLLAPTSHGLTGTYKLISTLVQQPDDEPYCLTLLLDVTEDMSVEHILGMASTGEYFEVMRVEKKRLRTPELKQYLQQVGHAALQTLSGKSTAPPAAPSQMSPLVHSASMKTQRQSVV